MRNHRDRLVQPERPIAVKGGDGVETGTGGGVHLDQAKVTILLAMGIPGGHEGVEDRSEAGMERAIGAGEVLELRSGVRVPESAGP